MQLAGEEVGVDAAIDGRAGLFLEFHFEVPDAGLFADIGDELPKVLFGILEQGGQGLADDLMAGITEDFLHRIVGIHDGKMGDIGEENRVRVQEKAVSEVADPTQEVLVSGLQQPYGVFQLSDFVLIVHSSIHSNRYEFQNVFP